ncbi:MAG: carbamoyl-phosphate synthase large subunit, partial [Alphaproteobacteria bacterium]
MSKARLLIANRGEIAIRIARSAAELGLETIGIYAEDDATSLHTRRVSEAVPLKGRGANAYLDADQIIEVAKSHGASLIHPGYGFLSESAEFARACKEAGLTFIGPREEVLELFGDKAAARALAKRLDVPLLPGTEGATTLQEATTFFNALPEGAAMVIKAIGGGGGRGMRIVRTAEEIPAAFERCQSEATAAFGRGDVYVEQALLKARHVEVQVIGDGSGAVAVLGTRECSLQRRHQKLIEIAPAPYLPAGVEARLIEATRTMAKAIGYDSLGTFEFLIDAENLSDPSIIAFIEANARLQVEHTVTEEVTGLDLVALQIAIALGDNLEDLSIDPALVPAANGISVQARINMETMLPTGEVKPQGGILSVYEMGAGAGLRVEGYGYAGYRTSPAYDSLLAKLIVTSPSDDLGIALARTCRALAETRIEGVKSNKDFLAALLAHEDVRAGRIYTRFIDDHVSDLVAAEEKTNPTFDKNDPLAILAHGQSGSGVSQTTEPELAEGITALRAPMQGTVLSMEVEAGATVAPGAPILIMEAMKMEHVISSETGGTVLDFHVEAGDTVFENDLLASLVPGESLSAGKTEETAIDLDHIRPDLQENIDRHAWLLDENRPEAVARRRKTGQRTVRENINDLCDEGSFREYGGLVVAAQRRRRDLQDLIERTQADGMVAGIGRVNGDLFPGDEAEVVAMSYDYTVLAGTQGKNNHAKKDRMFEVAEKNRLPVILFSEGGGGRPGDTDATGVAGL